MTTPRIAAVGALVAALAFAPAPARAAGVGSQSTSDEEKSPALAAALAGGAAVLGYGTTVGLSVWTDAEPAAAVIAGAVLGMFGPSAGHIYAGRNPGHPILFALGRLSFFGVALIGVEDLLAHDDGQTGPADKATDHTLIAVGLAGIAGLTIWEVADSYSCAKATHGAPPAPSRSLSFAPFFAPSRSTAGSSAGGLLLSGRF